MEEGKEIAEGDQASKKFSSHIVRDEVFEHRYDHDGVAWPLCLHINGEEKWLEDDWLPRKPASDSDDEETEEQRKREILETEMKMAKLDVNVASPYVICGTDEKIFLKESYLQREIRKHKGGLRVRLVPPELGQTKKDAHKAILSQRW